MGIYNAHFDDGIGIQINWQTLMNLCLYQNLACTQQFFCVFHKGPVN